MYEFADSFFVLDDIAFIEEFETGLELVLILVDVPILGEQDGIRDVGQLPGKDSYNMFILWSVIAPRAPVV
jgi:hypothetical protein